MIKGIILDYGGTLDTGGDHWSYVIYDAWKKAGVAADEAEFRVCYVWAERELARTRHILPHHDFHDLLLIKMRLELQKLASDGNFDPAGIDATATRVADLCYEAAKASIEKARPTLEALSARFPVVLVSNFYGNVETVLADFGIDRYFRKVIESAVVGVRKPDPRIFSLGVEALGLKPEEVMVIGDSYRKDIEPALKAGCHAVWIKGRTWSQEESDTYYPATIASLGDVLGLIDAI